MNKPLGKKLYGSIPHVSFSESGSDKIIHEGQERILFEQRRDENDTLFSSLKYDGSNTGVAKIEGELIPLIRSGHVAKASPYYQHILFDKWVWKYREYFDSILDDGDKIVGEWLAQAHATRYKINGELGLWRVFDLFEDGERITFHELENRNLFFKTVDFIEHKEGEIDFEEDREILFDRNAHQLMPGEEHEGLVFRCERNGEVDFLAKWVVDKQHGKYLPELYSSSVDRPIWNYDITTIE